MSDVVLIVSIISLCISIPVLFLTLNDFATGNVPALNELEVIDCDVLKDRLDQSYYDWYVKNAEKEFASRCSK